MSRTHKFALLLVSPMLALLLAVLSAWSASAGSQARLPALLTVTSHTPYAAVPERAPASACSKLEASEVAWVTEADDGSIDQQVDSYPSGSTYIHPVFQYTCVPTATTIVSVFTFSGKTIYTSKTSLRRANNRGFFGQTISDKNGNPLDEGEWGVSFFNGKALLTAGTVKVGGQDSSNPDGSTSGAASTITIQGTITDGRTGKPIPGAIFVVLRPGLSVDQFSAQQNQSDIYTSGRADSDGQYQVERPLARNQAYSVFASARGYKIAYKDGLTLSDTDSDPYNLDVSLTQQ